MSSQEPTPDQLAAMAYVDGELPPDEAAAFRDRLGDEPELVREVAALQRLAVLAKQVTPKEPSDYEWERLEKDPLQRAMVRSAFGLLAVGAVGAVVWGLYAVAVARDLPLLGKAVLFALILGAGLLFLAVLRARIRLLPYDAYTEVKR